jgi:hypothetical protein
VIVPAVGTVFLFLVLAGVTFPARGAELVVGSVKTAQGSAVVRRGADKIPTREGMHLLLNDILQTAGDGRLGVILQDGTRISLGPNTELKVDRFVYQPVEGKFGLLLQLGRGMLAYISGKIAQFSPESVSVETPVGVLGLRGTHFAVSIEEAK